jgi:hypothetical protein
MISYIGAGYFFSRRADAATYFTMSGDSLPQTLIEITVTNVLGFLCLAFALFTIRRARQFRISSTAYLLLALVVFAATNNPLNGSRSTLSAFLIALIGMNFDVHLPKVKATFVLAYTLGILLAMPTLDILARGNPGENLVIDVFQTYRGTPDYDGLQSIMDVVMWVQGTGIRWGAQLTSALFFFVPHAIWDAKPTATGVAAARFMGYTATNISAPLVSEFYADFGIFGVIALSVVTGWLIARADRRLDRSNGLGQRLENLPLYLLAGFSAIIARGALLSIVGPVIAAIGFAWLFVVTSTRAYRTSKSHAVG